MVRSIISLGHQFKLKVIAEGVETVEQLDFLRVRGCDEVQGYYYSRPLPAEEFVIFVESNPVLN
ncbi:EAL domain-containing protein [Candidatus Nitrotoga sp. M5]|uniref:EAL domain-containing protein n=1 Tax=Candidatus Nitrotoga sp. M5 TaxID=2890409 RepID=UPI00211298D0|nr:EAL domain-containing protein [Candidatus Nitrotoga sp. M5]